MKKNIQLNITLDWCHDIEKCNISINDKTYNVLNIDRSTLTMIKDILTDAEKQEIIDTYPDSSRCFQKITTKTLVEQLQGK